MIKTVYQKIYKYIRQSRLCSARLEASSGPRTKGVSCKEKRKRSDSALWQKPLHRQKNPKSNVTTQRTPPKTSITQRLRTDLGRSAGVTKATQLVWLNRFTGSQPSHLPQKPCNQKDIRSIIDKVLLCSFDHFIMNVPPKKIIPKEEYDNWKNKHFDS